MLFDLFMLIQLLRIIYQSHNKKSKPHMASKINREYRIRAMLVSFLNIILIFSRKKSL